MRDNAYRCAHAQHEIEFPRGVFPVATGKRWAVHEGHVTKSPSNIASSNAIYSTGLSQSQGQLFVVEVNALFCLNGQNIISSLICLVIIFPKINVKLIFNALN